MSWSEFAPVSKSERHQALESASETLFSDIFAARASQLRGEASVVRDLGRIETMKLPEGWIKGAESSQESGYSREYHPDGNEQVQLVLSYRGHRLSDKASNAFRSLIDSRPGALDPSLVQKAPLNEVLRDIGHQNTFEVLSARVQQINGEPALVVDGKYKNFDVNARFIYIDAERNSRKGSAPLQEIALIAPTKEFYKYAATATRQLENISWQH
jgi:hypothetical protein